MLSQKNTTFACAIKVQTRVVLIILISWFVPYRVCILISERGLCDWMNWQNMVQGECNQTCLNCWAAAHVLKEKDTCERVQSNYQNFRILKAEFLAPPLWLPLSRAFLYIYLYFPICISRANPEDKVKQWRGNATTRFFYWVWKNFSGIIWRILLFFVSVQAYAIYGYAL